MTINIACIAHVAARKLIATTHGKIDLCYVSSLNYHPLKIAR